MDQRFASIVESLHPAYESLVAGDPIARSSIRRKPAVAGVYLFSEAGKHLYVGRTRNMRNRIDAHSLPSSKTWSSSFGFMLARESIGMLVPTYANGEGSRKWLADHEPFKVAFTASKERIARMEFRFVEEEDPVRQAVLEIYCATVLDTPYNKFATT